MFVRLLCVTINPIGIVSTKIINKMSFGVGLADIVETLHFVKVTYDAWKEAPERYRTIESRLRSLRAILGRLVTHCENSHRPESKPSQRDLGNALASVEDTVDQLAQIIAKRSSLKFWDRLRLNSHQINDLDAALDRNIQDLTCLCSALSLENDRHLQHGQQALRRGQDELLHLVGRLLPAQVSVAMPKAVLRPVSSLGISPPFLRSHDGHDDPSFWRNPKRRVIEKSLTSREMAFDEPPLHHVLSAAATADYRGRRRTRSSSPQRLDPIALPEQYHSRPRPRPDKLRLSHAFDDGLAPHSHIPDHVGQFRGRFIPANESRQGISPMLFADNHTTVSTSRGRSRRRHRHRSRHGETELRTESLSEVVFMHR